MLVIVSLIQYFFELGDSSLKLDFLFEYSLMSWMMVYFGLAGNITALQRARLIWKSLS